MRQSASGTSISSSSCAKLVLSKVEASLPLFSSGSHPVCSRHCRHSPRPTCDVDPQLGHGSGPCTTLATESEIPQRFMPSFLGGGERSAEIAQLVIDVARFFDCFGNFFPQERAITLAHFVE